MASNTTTTVYLPRGTRKRALLLTLALLTQPGTALGQRGESLSNLVFDAVPLATAAELPTDFGGGSELLTQTQTDEVDRILASAEPLRRERSTSPELIELLAELGLGYQSLGRHDEAITTFDEAIELTHANGGRETLVQIPLLEQKIPSYLALGDITGIDDTEDLIYELKADNYAPASRDMYFATINLADWNTAAYFIENYRADGRGFGRLRTVLRRPTRSIGIPRGDEESESEEEVRLADTGGLNAIFSGEIRGVNKLDIIDPRLRRIDRLYLGFQSAVADTGSGDFGIAVDMAKRIARLAHLTKQEMDYERDNYSYDPDYDGSPAQALRTSPERMDESYDTGRQALEYVLGLMDPDNGVPPEGRAAALLDLGDWHLAYGQVQGARDAYRDARQTLLDAGFTADNIDIALATPRPLQIPMFATHLYSRASGGLTPEAELTYKGYIDVAFAVDEIGNGTALEFLGNSGEDTERIERILETQFRSIKFRPVLQAGDMKRWERVELRYYYAY